MDAAVKKDIGFNLYLISGGLGPKELVAAIEEALNGGVRAVQIREKGLSGRELFVLSRDVREITGRYGARLFINDRIDVALAVGADGVHLGVNGIGVKDARSIVPKGFMIGVSTHSIREALNAEEEGADFVTFGPVYHTPSKAAYGEPVGLEALKEVCKKAALPVFAIGGVKREKVEEVAGVGADGVAVISAILESKDREKSARELIGALNG